MSDQNPTPQPKRIILKLKQYPATPSSSSQYNTPAAPLVTILNSPPAVLPYGMDQNAPLRRDPEVETMEEILDRELPPSNPNLLVEYGPLLDRTVKEQYTILRELLEQRLPQTPQASRPALIISHAQQARSSLLKLLALLRWKKQADVEMVTEDGVKISGVGKALRLDSWIDDQHEHVRKVREHLEYMIPRTEECRIGNADLPTAIGMLSTGSYSQLPDTIRSWAQDPPQSLHPQEKIGLLNQMNRAIKIRLRLHEVLPPSLDIVDIRDGKLYLRAEDLFECALTTDTSDWKNQWFLVDVRFLVAAAEKGKEKELPEVVRAEIIAMMEPLLRYTPQAESETGRKGRNTSLLKLYDVLEHLALSLQLEAMYVQAIKLIRSEWTENLRVEMSSDRRSFKLFYWNRPPSEPDKTVRLPSNSGPVKTAPSYGGVITISMSIDEGGVDPVEEAFRSLRGEDSMTRRKRVNVLWNPSMDWLALHDAAAGQMKLSQTSLDLRAIVTEATQLHANALARSIHSYILDMVRASRHFEESELSFMPSGTGDFVKLDLFGRRSIKIEINSVTGHLDIRESEAVVASVIEERLRKAAGLTQLQIGRILDIILSLKISFVLDALEEKIVYLGFNPSRNLPVPLGDLAAHGLMPTATAHKSKPILVVPLTASSEHFLLILITHSGLRFATVQLMQGINQNIQQRSIASLVWLDPALSLTATGLTRMRPSAPEGDGWETGEIDPVKHDIDGSELICIWSYANATIVMGLIQAQLSLANIPWELASGEGYSPHSGSVGLPAFSASIKNTMAAGTGREILAENVIIRLADWRQSRNPKITASAKLALRRNKIPMPKSQQEDLSGTAYDSNKGILRYDSGDVLDFISGLVASWTALVPFFAIAAQIQGLAADSDSGLIVTRLQLNSVTVKYHEHWSVTLRLGSAGSQLLLEFATLPDGPINPHIEMRAMLEEAFEALPRKMELCETLLQYLRSTADVLGTVKNVVEGMNRVKPDPSEETKLVVCNAALFLVIFQGSGRRRALEIEYSISSNNFTFNDATISRLAARYDQTVGTLERCPPMAAIIHNATEPHPLYPNIPGYILIENGARLVCNGSVFPQTLTILLHELEIRRSDAANDKLTKMRGE